MAEVKICDMCPDRRVAAVEPPLFYEEYLPSVPGQYLGISITTEVDLCAMCTLQVLTALCKELKKYDL